MLGKNNHRVYAYIEALKLDNFVQVLSLEQRLQTCIYRAGYTENIPQDVQALQQWINDTQWVAPEFKFSESRELLWNDGMEWKPLTEHSLYKKNIF